MTLDQLLAALLGVGGAGGIAGLYNIVRAARKGKLDDEETLIKRLNTDNINQMKRADLAEEEASKLRRQRNAVWDQAAKFRRRLISLGVDDDTLEELVNFHD